MTSAHHAINTTQPTVYDELDVVPVIHAAGTTTAYGGSRMRPEVLQAMAQASEHFVSIVELNQAVGHYIASITGAEAGMVTSGAASGIVLSAAACMTGTDIAKTRRLPDTTGMRHEIVLQTAHRGGFTQLYASAGARIVQAGTVNGCQPEELADAITDKTAAIAYLCASGVPQVGPTLAQTATIAHNNGLPVIVDAAGMLPPRSNLRRFISEGADLVQISGGKYIKGPQNTGLLCGRADLVAAALLNANPHYAIGRPHKVSREEIVGLYTAIKLYLATDEDHELKRLAEHAQQIASALADIPSTTVSIQHDDVDYRVPTVVITLTADWPGPPADTIAQRLLAGQPRIYVHHQRQGQQICIYPTSLQPGEPPIVAQRVRDELTGSLGPAHPEHATRWSAVQTY